MGARGSMWLLLVVAAAVVPHIGHDQYVHDDHVVVEHHRQALWPPEWGTLASGRWFGGRTAYRHVAVSRPLATLSYSVEHGLGLGLPAARHAVQLGLYAALCLLVWALLRRFARAAGLAAPSSDDVAGAAALVFAAHPSHAEVVGSLANRPEILALLCTLTATWLLLRVRLGQATQATPVWATLAFAGGLWSKESAIGALGAWLVWAWAARARMLVRPLAAMGLVALAWLGWRWWALGAVTSLGVPPADNPLAVEPAGIRVLNGLALVWRAATHLAWPAKLAPDYTFAAWPVLRQVNGEVLAGALLAVSTLAALVMSSRPSAEPTPTPPRLGRRELLALALAWTAAHWLPVSNLLFPSTVLFADRLLTASSLGFAVLVALPLAYPLAQSVVRRLRWLPVLLLTPCLLWWSWQLGQQVWASDEALFEAGVARQPDSVRMRYDRAFWLAEHGRSDAARPHLAVAARLQPRDPDILVLGLELARGEHCADAERHLAVLASVRGPAVRPREAAVEWAMSCRGFARAWPLARLLPPARIDGDWPLRVYVLGIAAGDESGALRWAQAFVADPAREPAWVSAAAFADEQVGKVASAIKRLQDLRQAQPQLAGLDTAIAELQRRHPELAALPAEASATHGNP